MTTATAVGSPPSLNERNAVVTAVDPLSAIARSSTSRRPWASARRRDDGDGDGRLDRNGDGCRPPPRLNERDAVVARCCCRRRRCPPSMPTRQRRRRARSPPPMPHRARCMLSCVELDMDATHEDIWPQTLSLPAVCVV